MPNLFLLFSHKLTDDQIQDARQTLKVAEIIPLPEPLQAQWSNVPPEIESVREYLRPILDWLRVQARADDYVLVQGDFGAVYLAVNFALQHHLTPVYATTERKALETSLQGGTIQTQRIFRHVRYRRYEG